MAAKRQTKRTSKSRKAKERKNWRPGFLAAFEAHGMVAKACEVAKVSRANVYEERQRNEKFAEAWDEIEERTTQEMEREAFRRAVEGFDKPVYQGKELVGHIRQYSDTLLIFMLKARRPEVYREHLSVSHDGRIQIEDKLDAEIERLLAEMADAGEAAPAR